MFVQVSPSDRDISETQSSLTFAQRASTVELGPASKKVLSESGDSSATSSGGDGSGLKELSANKSTKSVPDVAVKKITAHNKGN